MKQVINFLLAIIIFSSCNNPAKEQPVTQQQISVQEKEMKEAIAKYPDSLLLRETLIQYYQDNGTADMALAEINKAIQIDSSDRVYSV